MLDDADSTALVSNLDRPYSRLPRYVSYVDESGHAKDPNRNYVSMAGLLATEAAWKVFDPEWRCACDEEGLTEAFHMMDFAAYKGQFKGWNDEQRKRLLGKLVAAIRNAKAVPIGSVVSVKDFNSFDPRLKVKLRDPHFMAFQPLTYNIAVAAGMEMPPGRVTMMYAHHPEHSVGLANTQDLWNGLRKHNPIIAWFMESYQCGEPTEHTPLQAADLWAYELGHHFEVIRPAKKSPRWPFQQFVNMGLNYEFTHDFITYHDSTGLNGLGLMSRVQRWKEISLYES